MKNKIPLFVLLTVFIVFTGACSPFAPKSRTGLEAELPAQFSLFSSEKTTGEQSGRWWENFNDPELNELIEDALSGNFSIKEARARLMQAKALSAKAGADRFPDLNFNAGTTQGRQRTDTSINTSTKGIENYSFGLSSAYEIDLWGKIRSEQEAVRLDEEAVKEDLSTAAMTLAAAVAKDWADIIAQRMQKKLLEKQLKTNQTYLKLIELRFDKGLVSALDVFQQRQTVEKVRAQIPKAEEQEILLMHDLALLLGRLPKSSLKITRTKLPVFDNIPLSGLPAELLIYRPDVRASALRLMASDWKVSAAKAARLPAVKLTGNASMGANDLDLIFDNWILSLAGNLTAPIFDANRRKAEVERTLAKSDESLWAYRRTVYTAVKEVEDALISEKKQREHINALEKEKKAAALALDEAIAHYRKGVSDYLPVLTHNLSVQGLERDLITQENILINRRISLYRALGGAWNYNSSIKFF
ncbi:putative RND efflux system, outer membrane lipoprotein, NodT family [Desulfonema limicola]|uniref:RND efflux system, outer membrane lipoprotein, NodT family n=1 Tax=Desulfonema limicola TaxID=45656 RepID=A0A975B8J7_9BACT|nr:efflux transporter outer membrane subunit [Desulfonema limicola]QTA80911.1 putative RND efflux system, outer membrane lipoprotein, NodT family [Desulfonema limicola]